MKGKRPNFDGQTPKKLKKRSSETPSEPPNTAIVKEPLSESLRSLQEEVTLLETESNETDRSKLLRYVLFQFYSLLLVSHVTLVFVKNIVLESLNAKNWLLTLRYLLFNKIKTEIV